MQDAWQHSADALPAMSLAYARYETPALAAPDGSSHSIGTAVSPPIRTPYYDSTSATPNVLRQGFDVDNLMWPTEQLYAPGSSYSHEPVRYDLLPSSHADTVSPLQQFEPQQFALSKALRHQRSMSFNTFSPASSSLAHAASLPAAPRRPSSSGASMASSSRRATSTDRSSAMATQQWLQDFNLPLGGYGAGWPSILSSQPEPLPTPPPPPHPTSRSSLAVAISQPPSTLSMSHVAPQRPPPVPLQPSARNPAPSVLSQDSSSSGGTTDSRSSVSTIATSVDSFGPQSFSPPTHAFGSFTAHSFQPMSSAPAIVSGKSSNPLDPERPYFCGYDGCGKTFKTNGHLVRHVRTHTAEKPFECMLEGCSQRFSRHDNMMQHYRTHLPGPSRHQRRKRDQTSGKSGAGRKRSRASVIAVDADDSYDSSEDALSPAPLSPKGKSRELADDDDFLPLTPLPTKRAAVHRSRPSVMAIETQPPPVSLARQHSGVTQGLASALDVVSITSPAISAPAPLPALISIPAATVSYDVAADLHAMPSTMVHGASPSGSYTPMPYLQASRSNAPPIAPVQQSASDALAQYRAALASHHSRHAGLVDESAIADDDELDSFPPVTGLVAPMIDPSLRLAL